MEIGRCKRGRGKGEHGVLGGKRQYVVRAKKSVIWGKKKRMRGTLKAKGGAPYSPDKARGKGRNPPGTPAEVESSDSMGVEKPQDLKMK